MKGDMNFLILSGCYRGAELHRGVSLARDGWWSLPGKNVHFIAPALIRRHPVRAGLLLNDRCNWVSSAQPKWSELIKRTEPVSILIPIESITSLFSTDIQGPSISCIQA